MEILFFDCTFFHVSVAGWTNSIGICLEEPDSSMLIRDSHYLMAYRLWISTKWSSAKVILQQIFTNKLFNLEGTLLLWAINVCPAHFIFAWDNYSIISYFTCRKLSLFTTEVVYIRVKSWPTTLESEYALGGSLLLPDLFLVRDFFAFHPGLRQSDSSIWS